MTLSPSTERSLDEIAAAPLDLAQDARAADDQARANEVLCEALDETLEREEEQSAPSTRTIVVLVGPPGAGKSTIGRRLARALNAPLVDSDHLIEQATGKSCGEVFTELGEPAFRELEAEHVASALQERAVVSLGGGAVITDSTRELLADHLVVWVDVSAEEGARRTAGESTRPVLHAEDPVAHYTQLINTRAPLYREVADYRARTDGRSPQQVVADILGFLESSE